jgi:hypothetical protein
MIAEQATVFALGPSAGSHLNTAVASIALGTDDIGRPHIADTITRRLRVPTAAKIPLLNARIGMYFTGCEETIAMISVAAKRT